MHALFYLPDKVILQPADIGNNADSTLVRKF
jgi:hypothetical protein